MPFTTNLSADWLLSGASVVDNVDAHTETAFGSPVLQHTAGGLVGVQLDNTGMGFTGESGDSFSGHNAAFRGQLSGFVAFYCENATPANIGPLFSKRDVSEEWAFYLTTALKCQLIFGSVPQINLTGGTAISANTLQTFGFSMNSAIANGGIVYTNGNADGTSTNFSFTPNNNGNPLLLCGENVGARSFPGTVFRLSLWKNRVISAAEFSALHADPFQPYAGGSAPEAGIVGIGATGRSVPNPRGSAGIGVSAVVVPGSTGGGTGAANDPDPWFYGVPLPPEKGAKAKAEKARKEREAQEEKVRQEAMERLAKAKAKAKVEAERQRRRARVVPETPPPLSFDDIIADALGHDGAELLMALLDN